MTTTTLSSKGQLVVPLEVRRKLGLSAGDQLVCEVSDDTIVLSRPESSRAKISQGGDGLAVFSAPEGAPEMSPEYVKSLLHD